MNNNDERELIKFEPDANGHIPVKCHYKLFPVMPFGKHRGDLMDQLPHSYLKWLASGKIGYFWELNAEYVLHGEIEPPTLGECVSIAGHNLTYLAIDAPYELKDELRDIPGSEWSSEHRVHLVPRKMITMLRKMFPKARICSDVPRTVREIYSKQMTLCDQ